MKKELCSLFLGLILMMNAGVAQEPSKPYHIRNETGGIISMQAASSSTRLPNLDPGSIQDLAKTNFPLAIYPGDSSLRPPKGQDALRVSEANCYRITQGRPQSDAEGTEFHEMLAFPAPDLCPTIGPVRPEGSH